MCLRVVSLLCDIELYTKKMERRRIKTKSCTCSLTELSLNKVDHTKTKTKKREQTKNTYTLNVCKNICSLQENNNIKRITQ